MDMALYGLMEEGNGRHNLHYNNNNNTVSLLGTDPLGTIDGPIELPLNASITMNLSRGGGAIFLTDQLE